MPITWSSQLETGIRQIDLQHEELVAMINAAEAAYAKGEETLALQEILPRLAAYVLFHFATEEALLDNGAGLQHAISHRNAHMEFRTRLAAMKADAVNGTPGALARLLDYLQVWLFNHIMVTDKELARSVHSVSALQMQKSKPVC
ncbi:MAG TPA: hemerythrin family protein [Noviherbaspirillum sp.]|nr:hemerythrin family protein [Noviherbaspirillum sp.]